ncbi:helix-turn-helix domain-containing protein [Larkinella soli]|uniref:helix-turn-helix domain-containing protein n=1 Tax=Larkinella soli TaxID=1770527 RepID=UPI000FFB98A0|nr:helix-turn-helix domain-containing protein [Larkinella soli]
MLIDFKQIQDDLNFIRETVNTLTEQLNHSAPAAPDDKPLSVSEAADFLGLTEQTIYQNAKRLPHRKRFGRLYFFRRELLAFLDGKEGDHA